MRSIIWTRRSSARLGALAGARYLLLSPAIRCPVLALPESRGWLKVVGRLQESLESEKTHVRIRERVGLTRVALCSARLVSRAF
jgi:hypothetical protein